MKYKLLACDVDGTLLTTDRRLADENIKAVHDLMDSGVKFVLSTGRAYPGVKQIAEKLDIENGTFILYNGAMVVENKKPIYSLSIDKDVALKIIEEGHKRNSTMILWVENVLYAEVPSDKLQIYKEINNTDPIFIGDLKKVCDQKVTKILWYDDPVSTAKYREEMQQILKDSCGFFISRPDFLEFVNPNCSKKTALEFVAKYYGIKTNETVAVGDSYNDIPMFMGAGLPVAMGNANEDIKSLCKYITDTCDNGGVAKLIYKLIKENNQ